jgi:hypothetical protein
VPREQRKLDYLGKLKERYGHLPAVRRIARYALAACPDRA